MKDEKIQIFLDLDQSTVCDDLGPSGVYWGGGGLGSAPLAFPYASYHFLY